VSDARIDVQAKFLAEFDAALDGAPSPGLIDPEDASVVREFAARCKIKYVEALERVQAEQFARWVTPAEAMRMAKSIVRNDAE
jgi:hypothetical protein